MPFLALLYMRHVRSWALVRQFILEGGLSVLSDCVADDNVYLRSQAIDTLMQITSTDLHDWFAEAPLEPAVHRRWLDLAAPSAKFMAHVAINLDKLASHVAAEAPLDASAATAVATSSSSLPLAHARATRAARPPRPARS